MIHPFCAIVDHELCPPERGTNGILCSLACFTILVISSLAPDLNIADGVPRLASVHRINEALNKGSEGSVKMLAVVERVEVSVRAVCAAG